MLGFMPMKSFDSPRVFVKGDSRKLAYNQAQVVSLKFDGYKETDEAGESAAPAASQGHEGTPTEPSGLPVDEPVVSAPGPSYDAPNADR